MRSAPDWLMPLPKSLMDFTQWWRMRLKCHLAKLFSHLVQLTLLRTLWAEEESYPCLLCQNTKQSSQRHSLANVDLARAKHLRLAWEM